MTIAPFELERFFARYEFSAPYLLCSSDCESLSIQDLLAMEEGAESTFLQCQLGYTESQGDPELRREIADLYEDVSPDEVLTFAGAQEAIYLFMQAVMAPKDHVIVQWPAYQSLHEVAKSKGCDVSFWQMEEANAWALDLNELEDMIRPNTRAIVVNFPNNPTGYMPSQAFYQKIIDLARTKGILIFSDEVYRLLEYHAEDRLPFMADVYENGLSLNVMSKAFGLAGLRVGWLVVKNKYVMQKLKLYKDYTTICNAGPSEYLAKLALRQKEKVLKRTKNIIATNLPMLEDFIQNNADRISWHKPQAGPIAFPKLLGIDDEYVFCEQLADSVGVMLLPGRLYGYGPGHVRVGFGRKNMAEALARFGAYLTQN